MDDGTSKAAKARTISYLSYICVKSLDEIVDNAILKKDGGDIENSVKDGRGRFRIWASNIGALQQATSRASLDSRLRDAPDMRNSVISGLERLQSTLGKANGIVVGTLPNRTANKLNNGAVEEETELNELLLGIGSSISHLFGLSVLIRRQRPKGRSPALDTFIPHETSPDISNVNDKFPRVKLLPWLSKRLGNAITMRRHLIHYRQLHRERLTKRKEERETSASDEASTFVSTLEATTIATTFEEFDSLRPAEDDQFQTRRISVLTSATSFVSIGDNENMGRQIPDLPDMTLDGIQLGYGVPFECPYCRTIQVVLNRHEWKKHVFADLQPYVCTYEICDSSSKLFPTRSEWVRHEVEAHLRQWVCIQCNTSSPTFHVESEIMNHLLASHPGTVTKAQVPMLIQACERPMRKPKSHSCPLCSDWKPVPSGDDTKEFARHFARHLQLLSLEALPLTIDGLRIRSPDEEDQAADSDSNESNNIGDIDVQYPPESSLWTCPVCMSVRMVQSPSDLDCPKCNVPAAIDDMLEMFRLLDSRGDLAKATEIQEAIVQRLERQLGPSHEQTIANMETLAGLYEKQGRYIDNSTLLMEIGERSRSRPDTNQSDAIPSADTSNSKPLAAASSSADPHAPGESDSGQSEEHQRIHRLHHASFNRHLQLKKKSKAQPGRSADKLDRLTPAQFLELSTDVYDEVERRGQLIGLDPEAILSAPKSLPPSVHFHPKRNQARHRLSTLLSPRFEHLVLDTRLGTERRFPDIAEREMHVEES